MVEDPFQPTSDYKVYYEYPGLMKHCPRSSVSFNWKLEKYDGINSAVSKEYSLLKIGDVSDKKVYLYPFASYETAHLGKIVDGLE